MWINRKLSQRVVELAKHFPAILITGARQTGKTALLRHSFSSAEYVTLDLPSAAAAAEHDGQAFLASFSDKPLLLDEVQYAPQLFRHLKVAIDADRHRTGRFLMTGSQKLSLMESVSESLAGRCAVLELDSLSAAEVIATLGRRAPSAEAWMWRGGYPELVRNPEMPAGDFYAGYVATYLERDVRQVLKVGSLRDFERFLRTCALRSGQLLNLMELTRDIGIAGSTARDWLSVLEATHVVQMLEPFFNNVGKRMIKTPKLYFRDTGLLCFLLGLDSPEALASSPFNGPVWETFVLGQIMRAKAATGSSAKILFWRDVHGEEVDFVIEHNGQLRLVETKWNESGENRQFIGPLQNVRDLLGVRAADENWIVCRTKHDHPHPSDPSVRVINGYRWNDWLPQAVALKKPAQRTVKKATKKRT